MKHRITTATLAMVVIAGSGALAHETYKADPAHASVGFSVSHLVISNVKGSFKDFSSTLVMHAGKLIDVQAGINVGSVDTGIADRDAHLKKEDFFNAEEYPEMTFKSKKVVNKDGKDVIVGDFTIRDVTKEVELDYSVKGPVKDPWGNTKLGLQASTSINRKDFGLKFHKVMDGGGLVVGDKVDITIDVEFALQKAPEKTED